MQEGNPLFPAKDYFSIREASRLAQVPPYTLRYWEGIFKWLRPMRKDGGHRRYSRRDLETILHIKDLLHNRRMTAAGARKALARWLHGHGASDTNAEGAKAPPALAKLLRDAAGELRKLLDEFPK